MGPSQIRFRFFHTLILLVSILIPFQIYAANKFIIGESKLIPHKAWPSTQRPKIDVQLYETLVDGERFMRMVFNCDEFYIQMSFNGNWKLVQKPSPSYSVQVCHYDNHNIRFSITEFREGEFLESLDEEQWLGYKKYLDRRFPKTKTYYEEEGIGLDKEINVFNKYYRQIAYSYKSSNNFQLRSRNVFTYIGKKLYVFTFSGPADSFEKNWNQQSFNLSRMELIKKTDEIGK